MLAQRQGAPVLRARNLVKRFGERTAVADIDLEEGPGCVAIVGPNGAGKSTLLRLAATLLHPDAGSIAVAGFDTVNAGPAARRALTYLAPHVRLPQRLTGREILTFTARAFGLNNPDRMAELIARFELEPLLERMAHGLSTGEHQRLSLARALLPEPQVLLIDEPSTGLDLPAAARLRHDLAQLKDHARLIVLATHDPLEIAAVADRVLVLRHGRVAWRGAVSALGGLEQLAQHLHALVEGDPSIDNITVVPLPSVTGIGP